MESGTSLIAFAGLALAGALHCAGMCGPLAAVASGGRGSTPAALARALCFALGKAIGYAVLGVFASRAGSGLLATSVGGPDISLADLRGWIALPVGLAMIVMGARVLGLARLGWRAPHALARFLGAPARALFASASTLPPSLRSFGFGVAASFLPCGLSWSALALAAGYEPLEAAMGSFVFGLATAPAICTAALGWQLLDARTRQRARWVGGVTLVLFGSFTAWRSGLFHTSKGSALLPACCAQESDAATATRR